MKYLAKMNNLPKHHGAGPNAAASVASAQGRLCWPLPNKIIGYATDFNVEYFARSTTRVARSTTREKII